MKMYSDGTPPQPKISHLPDTRKEHWSAEAWEKRSVTGTRKYHAFFTMHEGSELEPNQNLVSLVSGDVFILNVSKANGLRFYVDMDPGVTSLDTLHVDFSVLKELNTAVKTWGDGVRAVSRSDT